MKWIIIPVFLMLITTTFAQTGEITGQVRDAANGLSLPGANLLLFQIVKTQPQYLDGTSSDAHGVFTFSSLEAGDYVLVSSFLGYSKDSAVHKIADGEIEVYNPSLVEGLLGKTVVVHDQIDLDGEHRPGISVMSHRTLKQQPTRDPIVAITAKVPKIYDAKGDGTQLNFGGSRTDANAIYVDGVRIIGASNIPMGAVSSVTVYTGGIPARFGDFTGGVIEIKTRSYNYFTAGN